MVDTLKSCSTIPDPHQTIILTKIVIHGNFFISTQ